MPEIHIVIPDTVYKAWLEYVATTGLTQTSAFCLLPNILELLSPADRILITREYNRNRKGRRGLEVER